ncbi:MAG TPA: hypothetical protein VIQ74_12575 [Gemmatimonadaceae bacterium]
MDLDQHTAIEQELARLGLRLMDLPGLAVGPGGLDGLLQHLRGLPTGATWHDVLPELPRHWVPGRPETWTTRYRPFGPYDYQELPTGPAVHVSWPRDTDPECLSTLLAAARAARKPVYGAGFIEIANSEWRTLDAFIILERGTSQDDLGGFRDWLEEERGVHVASVPRDGTEDYLL